MKKFIIIIQFLVGGLAANSQNIGVGTLSPSFKLDVAGSINTDSVYRIGGNTVLSAKDVNGFHYTFVGVDCGYFNTTGNFNTGMGYRALYLNTTGSRNTAHGTLALYSNTSGDNTPAIGSNALLSNTTGFANTANGSNALRFNTTGYYNTASGYNSLYNNTTGTYNTAMGVNALFTNSTGSSNTAMGREALFMNTAGVSNTAVGNAALRSNTTGNYNTSMGEAAQYANTTGYFNTAIGFEALVLTTTSSYNTAIGYRAGQTYNLGWNNTLIGAEANVSFNGQYNSIAIGNVATCPDNSTVRIGNSANWSYGGYANWTNISDGRYKKNITANVIGLDFILRLRPVTYQLDVTRLSKALNEFKGREPDESMKKAIAEKEQMVWTGFVAQEVEEAAKQVGFEFSGVDKPRNEYGVYGLRYAEFVVPLVKAVQEQQALIHSLQRRIEEATIESKQQSKAQFDKLLVLQKQQQELKEAGDAQKKLMATLLRHIEKKEKINPQPAH